MIETRDTASGNEETIDEKIRRIRLLLLDRETGEERYCTLDEAETWDWANPNFGG